MGEEATNETKALEPSYRQLDAIAVKLWRIEGLISMGIIFLGALIGGTALWITTPFPGWIALLVWALLLCFLWLSAVWLPHRRYDAWSYRLDDRVLELRHGIFWRTSVMIPLTRLQHVDLKRDPLDRRFGVATLEVHTAGTTQASHEIPHLAVETGLELRERLIAASDLPAE